MSAKRTAVVCALAGLGAVLVFAFYYVFEGSFEQGEMYPEHSSLRAGPRGTMILYESLDQLSAVSASRHFGPFEKWSEKTDLNPVSVAWLCLDLYPGDLRGASVEGFVRRGGRVVVSLPEWLTYLDELYDGQDEASEDEKASDENNEAGDSEVEADVPEESLEPDSEEEEAGEGGEGVPTASSALVDWRLAFDDDLYGQMAEVESESTLTDGAPDSILWMAGEHLEAPDYGIAARAAPSVSEDSAGAEQNLELEERWEALYTIDGKAVVIGKRVGRGSIICLANGMPLTNESMYAHRDLELIRWLLDERENVIFDEYHFGIVEPKGIAKLIREYRLEAVLFGIAFSFALFVWYGLVPLMPSKPDLIREGPQRQTTLGGYRDLLRRYINPRDVLNICLEEWRQVFMARKAEQKRKNAQYQEAIKLLEAESGKPEKQRNIVKTYVDIASILNNRRT